MSHHGRCRMGALVIGVLLAALVGGTAADAQTLIEQMQRRTALTQTGLDGLTLGSIRLGDSETTVVATLGPPETIKPSALAERALHYELIPDLWLDVHTDPAGVRAIGLHARGEPSATPSPETLRGIQLEMPLARVLERYGDPPDGRLWYAAKGIAFNVGSAPGTEVVESILIFPRGTPAPSGQ